MKLCYVGREAISRTDVLAFITAMRMRNPTMGIPAKEDGLFVNLLIFDYLYVEIGSAGPTGESELSKKRMAKPPQRNVRGIHIHASTKL